MKVQTRYIHRKTKGICDIHDITKDVENEVATSGIINGTVTVFVPGSTAGITTVEFEPGLKKDLPELFEKLAPTGVTYHHDATWGDGNGFSHVRAALLGASLVVPFNNGTLLLGTWQQIVLIDFDNRARQRKVIAQIMGD
ncbi:MAG: YjbQ family protein [Deferribacteres bacterium]|nr:secondary thiamine-phosphate synthase enzyme YjbQ [candidate division KSB1 bacterium]MCB9500785.1 YjbQ family protein [Deferribacteres bacterium]